METTPLSAPRPAADPTARDDPARPGGAAVRDAAGRGAQQAASTAVLLATAPGSDGGPAAALRWEDTTLLGRLVAQLTGLGVTEIHVVTRPAWMAQLARALPRSAPEVRLHAAADRSADLRLIAELARGVRDGGLVVATADVLTQGEALAGLLADPRVATGALVTTRRVSRVHAYRTRARRGFLLGAATPYHLVRRPNGTFLGVMKLAPADRAASADVAERLADLLDRPLPGPWHDEFAAKAARWKLTLHRHGVAGIAGQDAGDEAPDDIFEDDDATDVEEQLPAGDVALSLEDADELRRRMDAAEQDVTALLLFGLVRSATRVGTCHLRQLFWARPLSRADIDRAAARIGTHDEEEALLASAVKANDAFFTTFFVSPYSKYIARWAARHGWTPNLVTALSALVGLLAAASFATGERAGLVAGAVLLQLAFTLDCVDGQLARYTRTFSAFGAWLDSIFDRAKEYAAFAGLAIGSAAAGDDVWLLACAALALQTFRHTMDFAFNAAQDESMLPAVPRPLEDEPAASPAEPDGPPPAGAADEAAPPAAPRRGVRAGVSRLERSSSGRWLRKLAAFPIGERFATISLTAALFDARVTFVALLALGGFAALYSGGGRVLRSLGRRGPVALPLLAASDQSGRYRDDGPLGEMLGRTVGHRLAIPPIALVIVAAAPLLAAAVIGATSVSWTIAGAVVAWAVLAGGVSSGRPLRDRLRWAVTPGLRLIEYGDLIWLAALAGDAAVPAGFAFLSAITFRHYDAFYRTRQRGDPPPRWIAIAAGGWDGRLLAAFVIAAAGAAPAGLYVAGSLLGALLVGESVASWIARGRAGEPVPYDDVEEAA
jgi:hypothetical protein